jgi:ApaG protein
MTMRSTDLGSEVVTRGMRVTVRPKFLPEQSGTGDSWRGQMYVFAYAIRITNLGESRARLLTRHWIIVDAEGERHEVRGEGVVGHQPDLAPGESFEYSSYCPLTTSWGTMEGEYQFEDEHGQRFDVAIGRFYLVAPGQDGPSFSE